MTLQIANPTYIKCGMITPRAHLHGSAEARIGRSIRAETHPECPRRDAQPRCTEEGGRVIRILIADVGVDRYDRVRAEQVEQIERQRRTAGAVPLEMRVHDVSAGILPRSAGLDED